jgi:hypothetical protein
MQEFVRRFIKFSLEMAKTFGKYEFQNKAINSKYNFIKYASNMLRLPFQYAFTL